ncbi:MAG: peptide deformylase [Candidatus Paceibacterota bacterium]
MIAKIVQKGNKVLRQIAKEVPVKDIKEKKIKDLIKKMSDVLSLAENGVALAAPQIGESVRLFIIDKNALIPRRPTSSPDSPDVGRQRQKKKEKTDPWVFINPVIKKISKKKQVVGEGCLSVEGMFGTVKRADKLSVEAYDENGKKFTRGASGLLAQIIQHETDHLNGIIFTDKAEILEKYKV